MKARVTVTLKPGVLDPQGKAIEGALTSLGIEGVTGVRQGKLFDLEIAGQDRASVERALGQACERLLANTVIENYRIEIADDGGSKVPESATQPDAEDVTEIAARDTDIPTEGHP